MNRIIAIVVLIIVCILSYGQSVEIGFVKEYNGEQAKTPLAGVELSVKGAPTTISDAQGHYELKFAVLKPGEAVKCNEIYKSGYIIFNKDALDYWRISKNRTPFVIVMCKESDFRELKKKFYGIIEKSYQDEYLRQLALVQKTASSLREAGEREKQLKKDYEEKLSNINTYVEVFARIDRSEMDSVVGKALRLVEEGKIEEGIKVYEQLQLSQQVQQMMDKLQAGETMLEAAQNMIDDTKNDLQTLAEKLKQQIGLYEMGGETYEQKRRDTMAILISVIIKLNRITGGMYNEDLGEWSCRYVKETSAWHLWTPWLKKAASLPSYHGLMDLAERYSVMAYYDAHLVDSVRYCYEKVLAMEAPEDVKEKARKNLEQTAEFYNVTNQGDTLFFQMDTITGGVKITQKTVYCYNKVSGDLILPTSIVHNGHKYDITGIEGNAFGNNRHLLSVTLPDKLLTLSSHAFSGCDSLQTAKLNEKLKPSTSGKETFPLSTTILVPSKFENPDWVMDFLKKRYISIFNPKRIVGAVKDSVEYHSMRQFLMDLQKVKGIRKDDKELFLSIVHHMDSARVIAEEKNKQQIVLDSATLWKQLSQLADSDKLADHGELRRNFLQYFINIAQETSALECYSQMDAVEGICNAEMVAIGIIAIQAMIKGKSISQLRKYTGSYMSVAVKWAIRNELRYRHEWHIGLKKYNEASLNFGENWTEQIEGLRRLFSVIKYNTFVNNSIKNTGKASENAIKLQKYALRLWTEYENATKMLETREQLILTDLLTGTEPVDDVIAKYGITRDDCKKLIYLQENMRGEIFRRNNNVRLKETLSY